MSAVREGRPERAAPLSGAGAAVGDLARRPWTAVPSWAVPMLYYSMKHRTQLYLDEAQYRWLRQRAGESGSIAAVVRGLIDAERARRLDPSADPLLRYLVEEEPGRGAVETSVGTLDRDVYGR